MESKEKEREEGEEVSKNMSQLFSQDYIQRIFEHC